MDLKVAVIVTGSTEAALAAKRVGKTVHIVMTGIGDPVAAGLAASLARPGGTVTGLSAVSPELNAKRLELLVEAVPRISRIAVIFNGANPSNVASLTELERAASNLRIELQSLDVRGAGDLERAFDPALQRRADALLVQRDALYGVHRDRINSLAAKLKLPTMHAGVEAVQAGGLMSYGVHTADLYRRAATYVDKILKGANPADLPIERPVRFELAVNLKAARALGVPIPASVLLRADKVIE
jgi:putative tryptophan/tyrosine transport system substrate-binding protein